MWLHWGIGHRPQPLYDALLDHSPEKRTDAFPDRGCFSLMNSILVGLAMGEQRGLTKDEEGAHR
jgi:hypothetical protein